MTKSLLDLVLEGLPQPNEAGPAFYGAIDANTWPHVQAIANTCALPQQTPDPLEARLYLAALARITQHWWNPFKYGPTGEYTDIPIVNQGTSYHGHNIAALAVADDGRVVDFEMNHNEIFRSSAEHAESRLVRRMYQLANVHQTWNEITDEPFQTSRIKLDRITIYTTLQPCAQCAGIMTLAQVKSAVFLQADPGMYLADILMRALSPGFLKAPMPLPASLFGIDAYRRLNEGYARFWQSGSPLWQGPDGPRGAQDITAYLCTNTAFQIFTSLAREFDDAATAPRRHELWDNPDQLIDELREFVAYACSPGAQRGAPHRV